MSSAEKRKKSDLVGVLDSFISNKRRDKNSDPNNPTFINILEFIDTFQLLPQGLYPVQKFLLKLYYNIPLDDTIPEDEGDKIKIQDRYGNFIKYLSEVDYLTYLYQQGRCNVQEQDDKIRRELILVLGRRSGKSTLSSIITVYELYKLLGRGCPQDYYGMPSTSEIRIICVANDKDQAEIIYGAISAYTTTVNYFKDSLIHDTKTYQQFQTEKDAKTWGKGSLQDGGRGTLTVTFKSSVAKGLRGRGNIITILDEIAFFVNDGKSSAYEIYRAITPATKQFTPKNPKDKRIPTGPTEGRVILISSPDAKQGFFFEQYQTSLSKTVASRDMLMIQAPTWEVNPSLTREDYEVEYAKDPSAFDTEYGAQFSDRVRGWIENSKDLTDCVNLESRPLVRGLPKEPFFAGVDFGLAHDGTAISLTHLKDGKISLGYHEIWYPKKSWKDSNPHLEVPLTEYAHGLKDIDRLDIDEIVKWFDALTKRFYIEKGVFDQYAGHIFEQALHKVGLHQFEMKKFTTAESSEIYTNAKLLMLTQQLNLYDYPIPEIKKDFGIETELHSPHIQELLELQSTSGGKNIIVVEAPNISGKHDDFSDSYMRSVMLATEYISKNPYALDMSHRRMPGSGGEVYVPMGYKQFHRHRQRLHGGVPKERRIPGRR